MKTWLFPVIAGALLPFGFAPYFVWPVIIPAIWLLSYSLSYQKPLRAALQGWLFGLAFFGVGVSWVFVSIHEHGNAPAPLAAFLTLLFVVGISLFPALQLSLTAKLTPVSNPYLNSLSFFCCWVIFEWIRSWFLTGFPWLLIGNAFIDTPLAGWGPVLGVFGITALVLVSALVLQTGWRMRSRHHTVFAATVLVTAWLGGWGLQSVRWTQQEDVFRVSMVQANIAQADKWKTENKTAITREYLTLTDPQWTSDLIIWPETALPYFQHQAESLLSQLHNKAKATNTALALGLLSADFNAGEDTSVHNSFTVVGQGKGLYHKQKLVPFGEYVPLEKLLRGLIDFFNLPMSDMQPGGSDQTALSFRDQKLMPLICYEVVYPDFVATYAQQAGLLVTVSNDSWFGASIGPHQHLQIAQMRALETQRFVLRATNNGITAIINPQGKIDSRAPQFERAVLRGEASIMLGSTPFMLTGSWPLILFTAALACYCGYRARSEPF